MTDQNEPTYQRSSTPIRPASRQAPFRLFPRRIAILLAFASTVVVVLVVASLLLVAKASTIRSELTSAAELVPEIKAGIAQKDVGQATTTVSRFNAHTSAAREAAEHPLWTLASALPLIGANFSAITEVARSADDVSSLAVAPLVRVFQSLDWDQLVPSSVGAELEPLQEAAPTVSSAAHAVRASAARLQRIDVEHLLPQVREPLLQARQQLQSITGTLDASADASQIAPGMLGADGPRTYLLMIQNNAEARASGGIPGALAVITVDQGKLTMGAQSTAADVGVMSPPLDVDLEQEKIYSKRLGKFMQDVNLTPDFPTAARTAQAMWEKKTGQRVEGVISLDPVALSYMLSATGPIKIANSSVPELDNSGLSTELSQSNVVGTLLSDVYSKIESPELQDLYFAAVAKEVFGALTTGKTDTAALIEGLTRGAAEGRVLLWSASANEEKVISSYPLSGSIKGPSTSPAQFGVYLNDGTGAKMDYYVKRTVQLISGCSNDGYQQIKVRVTSKNTAPSDAATSLPQYVTGAGAFGVPAGTVQTNVVAYGPVQSHVDSVTADGKKISFASQMHSERPVGTVTVALPPGKSSTIEFLFDKIVQNTEPKLSVTPTVQAHGDVVLDSILEDCQVAP
ncbi:DUF4012 domain-containing protein [Arthrobacter sp. NPDC093125]|uniref:DUF4012 domain-containing protein n=1 Tax=Arthrobacter sp. NPDC093125 TaxID=3363944 RepID=UPI003801B3C5